MTIDCDRHLPFTTQSALASGMTMADLHSPHWRAVMPDVWIAAGAPMDRDTWRDAARLVLPPDSVLCGLSALAEHGLELRPDDDVEVHVSTIAKPRKLSREVVNHRLALEPDEVVVLGRWLVTTAHRTAFDCVRWADPATVLDIADAITRAGIAGAADLLAYAEMHQRVHGTRQVREVVAALGSSAAA